MKHEPSFAKGSSQRIKNKNFLKKFKKVTPKLAKGDALIHNALIVHGSKKNISNLARKGITFQFVDKNAKIDLKNMKKYEEQLYKQLESRN